jgi:orotate phosphoribosyltransferase
MLLSQVDKDAVAVGGLTLGADPLVSGVTVVCGLDNINLSGLIVRKKAKGHGTGAWIEGPELPEGSVVTVLEDVITTGGSSIEAVKRIRDAGYKVNRVVSIIDRQENSEADTAMKWQDLELISLYKLEDLI